MNEQQYIGDPVTRAVKPCPFGDPTCPCQDGDACHYVAVGDTKAMAPPTEEQKRAWAALGRP